MRTSTRHQRLERARPVGEVLPSGLRIAGAALALAALVAMVPIGETFLVAISQAQLLNHLSAGSDSIGLPSDPAVASARGGTIRHQMICLIVWCAWCLLPIAVSWRMRRYSKTWLTAWSILTIGSLGGLWILSSWLVIAPTERLLQELQPPTDSWTDIAQSASILEDSAATDPEREQACLVFRKLGVQSRAGFVESADQQLKERLVEIATATDGSAKQKFYAARALLAVDAQTPAERAAIIAAFRMAMIDPDADLRALAAQYAQHPMMNSTSGVVTPTRVETDITSHE